MNPVRKAVMHHLATLFGFDLVSIDDKKLDYLVNHCAAEGAIMERSRST